jgi:hypothetical protein
VLRADMLWPIPVLCADGRDVPDGSSVQFTQHLKDDLAAMEAANPGLDAKIASGGGRMQVTMDRYEVCAVDSTCTVAAAAGWLVGCLLCGWHMPLPCRPGSTQHQRFQ